MVKSLCSVLVQNDLMELIAIEKVKEITLVCREAEKVIVVSARMKIKGEYFVKLIKLCKSSEEAHEKVLHILGKLVLKKNTSKYFNCPKYDEHMRNGVSAEGLTEDLFSYIRRMANRAVIAYHQAVSFNAE